jgi:peptidoglycan hydrolase-like protein with peptidoglycan-binding domain
MALESAILSGNTRLEQAVSGGPSVKKRPPDDDADAVRRIQNALVALGIPLPKSFSNGAGGAPDGIFGDETHKGLQKFQQQVFPSSPGEWDGRAGKKTLTEMDQRLPKGAAPPPGPQALTMSALAEQDKVTSLLWAGAALRSLATARLHFSPGGGASLPGQFVPPPLRIVLQALETHFRLSTAANKLATIDFIIGVYQKAVHVLGASSQFFIDDTTSQEALNGTPAHVPFGKGKVNFTPAFRERTADGKGFGPKCRAAMVLHEPVHIVDHPQASNADNHIHENSAEYATKPAKNQIHNAHSYACFAQHCFFGSDTRFGIGKPDQ